MRKILIIISGVILLLDISAIAQVDLHFDLKESLELPGNAVFNLKITDMNSDNFADYLYNDSTSIKVVDGSDLSVIFETALPPGFKIIESGDFNNDAYKDIAIAGVKPNMADSGFIDFYGGPEFEIMQSMTFEVNGDSAECPTELLFSNIGGRNLIIIGTGRRFASWGDYREYRSSGGIIIFSYSDSGFTREFGEGLNGSVNAIAFYNYDFQQYVLIKTAGQSSLEEIYWGFWWDYSWADLFILDGNFNLRSLWHTGLMRDFYHGIISGLNSYAPDNDGDEYAYFYSYDSGNSVSSMVCMNAADSLVIWRESGDYRDYNIILTELLHGNYKDVFIFDSFFHIRDPWSGYLTEIGQLFGTRGQFQVCSDQDGDGIDEFYYLYRDSVYIYNSGLQTSINYEVNELPAQISLFNNYPNPFNSRTQINFDLTSGSTALLEIYDIQGRKIETVLNQYLQAGNYSISWQPGDLASGVYFCRLITGDADLTDKMVILK